MTGIKKRMEITFVSSEIGMNLLEELSRRELEFRVAGRPDLRIGKITSWCVSIWLTKAEWMELRSELYPVYGSHANFYTSSNVKNMK